MSEQISLRDNPQLDSEALLLSAALWSRDSELLKAIGRHLTEASFHNPLYGQIFNAIATNTENGRPVNPASIRDELIRRGVEPTTAAPLVMLTTLGASDLQLCHYAVEVSSQAYRRSYHSLATAVADAAAVLPENQLFDRLVDLGRQQRAHWNAHRRFCESMGFPVAQKSESGHLPAESSVTEQKETSTHLEALAAHRLVDRIVARAPLLRDSTVISSPDLAGPSGALPNICQPAVAEP